ncbi:MAG: SDR family oxidoreductase [Chitinophagales bacterium]|nr:SDR family oxidoreductase [Chitinophagales bacterium]
MPKAIITGATQGIGKAITEKLLSQGFDVAVCARTESDLQQLAQEWKAANPDAEIITYRADMGKKEEVLAFATHVLSAFKSIDLLVNNAGLFFPGKLMEEPDGHLETLMEVNMYSAYYLTRAVQPSMPKRAKSHIFNICSVASLKAYPNGGSYGITKYALLGFSENLREELKEDGIRVTSICPGATYSRSWEGAGIDPERFMEANDVAEMLWAAYHLSAKADVETLVMRPIKGDL